MLMKTILALTDFSANAANAIRNAVALANLSSSKLILVHILPLEVMTTAESGVYTSFDPVVHEHYATKLNDIAKEIQLENGFRFEVEAFCEHGPFNEVVNALVISSKADLVVMGYRGNNSFLDKVIGSTTAAYMKMAACPVLAIPSASRLWGFSKIAYASDFTGHDLVYLQQLFRLTEPFKAQVFIVNVKTKRKASSDAEDRMLQDMAKAFPNDRYCITQVKADSIPAGIMAFISDNKVNVLAVSQHERSLLEDLFHKSVAKELALETTVPLLSLPEKPYNLRDHQAEGTETVAG